MIKITEINPGVNSIIEREATPEELAQMEIDLEESKLKQTELKSNQKAKEELLARLGITPEEAVLLLS